MAKFKLKDKHIAFVNAIASGVKQSTAWIEHMAESEKVSVGSASVSASRLLARPEIQDLLKRTKLAHEEAITGEISRKIAEEFKTDVLTVEELDSFHSSIIQGKVLVEEVVPVYTYNETVDAEGKVVKRTRQTSFVNVKRPPNIREKQISIDALYKRKGSYAPSKFFGALKNLNNDDELPEEGERVVLLSDGTKIPLLPAS